MHALCPGIARLCGSNAALLFNHIYFWTEVNRKNESQFFDGYYWFYSSYREFQENFDYMTGATIKSSLAKLEHEGLVVTANYSGGIYCRTKWYAVTEKARAIVAEYENGCNDEQGFAENGKTVLSKSAKVSKNKALEDKQENNTQEVLSESAKGFYQNPQKGSTEISQTITVYNNTVDNNTVDNITAPSKSEQYADVLPFFLKGGVEWRCPQDFYDEMVLCHPSVDIEEEFMNMRAWTVANPKQRKTKEGAKKFVRNWLSKARDNYKYKKPRDSNFDSFLDDIERGD